MSGYLGTSGKRLDHYGERVQFEELTSDPATTETGDMWLRVDLAPEVNQLATLRFDAGASIWDIPVFETGTSSADVEEVYRIPIGGQIGYVPTAERSNASFSELSFSHNGILHGLHNDVELPTIPDSDLTQYSLTDPDGRVTVQSSTAYDASLPNGSNEVARLYDTISLDTFIYSFDFSASSYANNAAVYFGFGNQADTVTSAIEAFTGIGINPDSADYMFVTATKDPTNGLVETEIAPVSVGDTVSIEVEYDVGTTEVTGRIYDGTGSLLGETTVGYDGSYTYDQHYAMQSRDAGFTSPGSIDFSVTNHGFEAV